MSALLSIVPGNRVFFSAIASLSLLFLAACGYSSSPSTDKPPATLTIAAASDLAPMARPLQDLIRHETGHEVVFSFASSGSLTRQIEQGAPFDVFLSANEAYISRLAGGGFVETGSVRAYALGRLGLWYKDRQDRNLARLLSPEITRIAIPNPDFAPYGIAAKDLLTRAGLWEKLLPKIIYGENVRQTAQFASSGNVDAALSSWTTIRPLGGTLLHASSHAPIRQAGAVVSSSASKQTARQALQALASPAGVSLLREHGFEIPE